MVGTGMITIPWAMSEAGLILGICKFMLDLIYYLVLIFLCFIVSFYTCYLVVETAGSDIDFTDTLMKLFGRKGWIGGMVIFIFNLSIPIIL